MKFSFSLKNKEAKLEADVERLVEKGMENRAKNPIKKTRYQIRQEEKRKTLALNAKQERMKKQAEQKSFVIYFCLMMALLVFILLICFIGSQLGWE